MFIENEIAGFKETLSKELTTELAGVYVHTLLAAINSKETKEGILKAGEELHYQAGKELYGPLLAGYVQWVEKNCSELNHNGPVCFALRDAAPLMEAANILWQGKAIYPVGIYANRPLLGIEDEISPDISKVNGNIEKYFKNLGILNKDKIVWVDTGAWGTVVRSLKEGLLKDINFHPLFWYSHNPHIPGYINDLLSEIGVDESWGEVINDSIECLFPQQFLRPTSLEEGKAGWQVKLEKSGNLSQVWGKAALLGVRDAAMEYMDGISIDKECLALAKLIEAQKIGKDENKWTGVLPTNTPTWSNGEAFIKSWPKDLLP